MNNEMQAKTYTVLLSDKIEMKFISNIYKGRQLDTRVYLDETYLCTIKGDKKLSFMYDLNKVIDKYKI